MGRGREAVVADVDAAALLIGHLRVVRANIGTELGKIRFVGDQCPVFKGDIARTNRVDKHRRRRALQVGEVSASEIRALRVVDNRRGGMGIPCRLAQPRLGIGAVQIAPNA